MYRKELAYYFSTPIAYIVIGLYQLAVALLLWVVPGEYNIPQSGYAQVDGLFQLSPVLFMFLCPAVCMRLIAEERQSGTWTLLMTKPVSLVRIVLSKYAAALTLIVLAQLPCIIHYILVYNIAQPVGNIDGGAFFGGMLGLVFLSAAYSAISLWASSLSKSQIVTFIIALALCFMFYYGFDLIGMLFSSGKISTAISSVGLHAHYDAMMRGVIDGQDVAWFATISLVFILLTIIRLDKIED